MTNKCSSDWDVKNKIFQWIGYDKQIFKWPGCDKIFQWLGWDKQIFQWLGCDKQNVPETRMAQTKIPVTRMWQTNIPVTGMLRTKYSGRWQNIPVSHLKAICRDSKKQ